MNKNVCATLGHLIDALKDNINVEDIIYAKTTSQIVSSLVRERFKRRMTLQDFANKLCVKQSMISRWESGNSNFTVKTLSKIAADLDLDLYVNLVPHKEIQFKQTEHYQKLNPTHPTSYSGALISPAKQHYIYASTNNTHKTFKEVATKW